MAFRLADLNVRDPYASEVPALAHIWHDGYHEKSGWSFADTFISRPETPDRPFDMEVWHYEKRFAE